jgi:hypothetical protein
MPKMLNAILEQVSDVFSNELQKKVSITEINPEALIVWEETWECKNTRQPPDGGWDVSFPSSSLGMPTLKLCLMYPPRQHTKRSLVIGIPKLEFGNEMPTEKLESGTRCSLQGFFKQAFKSEMNQRISITPA